MSAVHATLLVVAKAPVAGLAKTRLTSRYHPIDAADLAAAALLDTLRAVQQSRAGCYVIALAGDLDQAQRREELVSAFEGFEIIDQRGDDFASRLVAAHADAFALGGAPVFQIGMDTPQVTPQILQTSLECLLSRDVGAVLGPASDGGWWGLGVTDPKMAAVLSSVTMSQSDTGAATRRALESQGWHVGMLGQLDDVDTPEDVDVVAASIAPTSEFARTVRRLSRRADSSPIC